MARKKRVDRKRERKELVLQQVPKDELDAWLNQTQQKYDDVLRRLAGVDEETLTRVRANLERYRSTLERLAGS